MAQRFSNGARANLLADISNADTTLTIDTGGSLFPVADTGAIAISAAHDWFKLVLQDATYFEIVYVRTHTSGSTTFSDVLRGQEGTTARSFLALTVVAQRPTAGDADGAEKQVNKDASGGYAGLTAFALNLWNTAGTFKNVLVNATTAVRTWTWPDKSGTVAMLDDVALKANLTANTFTGVQTFIGVKGTKTAMAASDIDMSLGEMFTKTISGTTTLTVSNIPAAGLMGVFVLELTNGGSATLNLPANSVKVGGTAWTLTTAGKDVLVCYVTDGSTLNWFIAGKDVK